MTIEIPDFYRGRPIEGAMKRLLEGQAKREETEATTQPNPAILTTGRDTSDYIFVPSLGFYIAKERTLLNLDWNQTQEELAKRNEHMPTPFQMRVYLKYLKDNSRSNPEYQSLFNEILQVRNTWRGNWLDASFEKRKDGMYMTSINPLNAPTQTKLEDFLTKDKIPGISLDSWLNSSKPHGLPQSNLSNGDLYYWAPRNGSVAGLVADADGAYLGCGWVQAGHDGSLGVFPARSAVMKKSGGKS